MKHWTNFRELPYSIYESFFEGKTHVEIAEEMNLSVKSINRYKQKTMELLRNELKDYLPLLLLLIYRT